ncbi:hypothetical protein OEZ86_009943 [Tetradesmus obliquus]|uniref:HAD family hydrolase n=1 Tax=Tetradesmus obliquus TaxID=3088 RepID=A0ABY8UU09_TETOB|nr:hypothetical protein OEZ85_001378 [Tetradesmus obliquus]WIA43480.1 hypothetical protein OEZ86_009943 [Tetradesmus obliquus]
MVTASAGKRVVALDFDGVVCDSVGESSLSAFKAAAIQWPEIFQTAAAEAAKPQLVEQMRAVRPVVETGYENVVQIRCLYEGVTVEQMLAGWHDMLPAKMKEWGLQRSELVELFGGVRDSWIADDLAGWLAPNRIYPGVADAVAAAMQQDDVYIVTTKQAHYTEVLLRDMAGISFPSDRIHSTTVSGEPKASVLGRLAAQHADAAGYIFVEDKHSTLEKVTKAPGAEAWQLYLVDWGYNTPAERQAAAADPRITVVDLQHFQQLMGLSS